ncbi:MAG: hypothetical protein PHW82_01080 [Bacteroidales bacterium]|nr:hypothetical protein [Bacteroidales bacterium]
MVDNNDIENKIKESFESLNSKAPQSIWDNISDKLDVPVDESALDSKLKDSFENINHKAPEFVWKNINRQLNIDSVWLRISRTLSFDRFFYWAKRIFVGLTIITLFVFLGNYFTKNNLKQKSLSPQNNVSKFELNKRIDNNVVENTSTINKLEVVSDVNVENELPQKVNLFNELSTNADNGTSLIQDKVITYSLNTYSAQTITEADTSLSNDEIIASLHISKLDTGSESLELIHSIPINDTELIESNNTLNDSIILFNEDTQQKDPVIILGLIASINNTLIINSSFKQSKEMSSLVFSSPTYVIDYGLLFGYKLNSSSAILCETFIKNGYSQQISAYNNGRFYTSKTNLNYVSMVLLYEHKLPFFIFENNLNFVVKAGAYYSYLRKSSRYVNNTLLAETPEYANSDYGIRLLFGQQKSLKKLTIDYGINSSYGLKNIYSGSDEIPAGSNKTNNFYFGIYLSLSGLI